MDGVLSDCALRIVFWTHAGRAHRLQLCPARVLPLTAQQAHEVAEPGGVGCPQRAAADLALHRVPHFEQHAIERVPPARRWRGRRAADVVRERAELAGHGGHGGRRRDG